METPEVAKPTAQKYVAGFYFDMPGESVALVRKIRPKWQAGKLNAIGGHIEFGERAIDAMVREFYEETGYPTEPKEWRHFAALGGDGYLVHFFETRGEHCSRECLRTLTDEEIVIRRVADVMCGHECIPNLRWLLPLALDKDQVIAEIKDPIGWE